MNSFEVGQYVRQAEGYIALSACLIFYLIFEIVLLKLMLFFKSVKIRKPDKIIKG